MMWKVLKFFIHNFTAHSFYINKNSSFTMHDWLQVLNFELKRSGSGPYIYTYMYIYMYIGLCVCVCVCVCVYNSMR